MTNREGCIISAYTGFLCVDFPSFHAYVEEVMKRPVFTHELGNPHLAEEIKLRSKADFLVLAKQASK